jgi:tetratricopeptide (TPR) repeat protein
VSIFLGIEFAVFLETILFKEIDMSTDTSFLSFNSMTVQELIAKAEGLDAEGRTHEALELFRHWLKHDRLHNKYSAWFNYGWMLQKANRLEEATEAYDQVINCYADHLAATTSVDHSSAAYA